jgi:hypothetical protein
MHRDGEAPRGIAMSVSPLRILEDRRPQGVSDGWGLTEGSKLVIFGTFQTSKQYSRYSGQL